MKIQELIERILSEFTSNSSEFEPFIQHIRFPKYKNFVTNTKIDFIFSKIKSLFFNDSALLPYAA